MRANQWTEALEHACAGEHDLARQRFGSLLSTCADPQDRARLLNNLAALDAAERRMESAQRLFGESIALGSRTASPNVQLLTRPIQNAHPGQSPLRPESRPPHDPPGSPNRPRIAILSLLFNWPSTGGGTVHTKELADFLTRDGYEVQHLFAVYEGWQVGQVTQSLPYPHTALSFSDREWTPDQVRARFRDALQRFQPDQVIITDSWNSKPLLAEAAAGFPYFLRIAAQEGICPLNNLRLLVGPQGPQQCDRVQLADPAHCRACVQQHAAKLSGPLHQVEREFSGYFEPDYGSRLQRAFRGAAAVLVVNPQIAELVRPHAQRVEVIPSGFDPARFPAPTRNQAPDSRHPCRILFAGMVEELMKGFQVLQQAGDILWRQQRSFEIVATADPVGQPNAFTRFVGWQSQEQLPELMRTCDVLVFPTIAQEALGRTAVEAMGCGLPVVASRIGGLAWVVEEEQTGLLCAPGDPHDLARQLGRVIADPTLRQRLGQAGRKKFEREFVWKTILRRHYEPLLRGVRR